MHNTIAIIWDGYIFRVKLALQALHIKATQLVFNLSLEIYKKTVAASTGTQDVAGMHNMTAQSIESTHDVHGQFIAVVCLRLPHRPVSCVYCGSFMQGL